MVNIIRNKAILSIALIIILTSLPISAQLKTEGLIFSEICLNENEQEKSWIEIYNPTNTTLTVERFRTSNVLTSNLLPDEIRNNGGLEIAPAETVVLCADRTKLSNYDNISIVEIEGLCFGEGGFISMKTKELKEKDVDIVRFGNPEKTKKIEDEIGEYVVPFSDGNQSYSRIQSNKKGEYFHYEFSKTELSPGTYVKNGGQDE